MGKEEFKRLHLGECKSDPELEACINRIKYERKIGKRPIGEIRASDIFDSKTISRAKRIIEHEQRRGSE